MHDIVAACPGARDKAVDPLLLARTDDRAEFDIVALGPAIDQRADHGFEPVGQGLNDVAMGKDPAGGSAVLAGIVERSLAQGLDQFVEIGIGTDDDRRLAAQFEMGALDHRAGGGLQYGPAGADVAGQRDHAHKVVRNQRMAHVRPVAGDDIDDAGGQDFCEDFRQRQEAEWRQFRRLDDHCIACRDSRGDLPGGHQQRVVPGSDLGHDANRVAADQAGAPRSAILAG